MTCTARVTLRYRPGADVLTGTVDLGEAGGADAPEIVEVPDADTQLVWRSGVLSSFQLVFAAARTGQGALPVPAALWPAIDTLIVTAMHALNDVTDVGARMRARAEATCEVPVEELTGPAGVHAATAPRQRAIDRRTTERLVRSLSRLADAVHTRVPLADGVEALHTDHLARLLRELSTTVTLHHSAASGTTAAARVAARSGEALQPAELELLEAALDEMADPAGWGDAGAAIEHLIDVLGRTPE